MFEIMIVVLVGFGIVIWLLQYIRNYLKAIHFMMRKEFGAKYGLGDDV
jgi:hypothetical protein